MIDIFDFDILDFQGVLNLGDPSSGDPNMKTMGKLVRKEQLIKPLIETNMGMVQAFSDL